MKILFISLGCEKNRVETEYMLGILAEHGYEFTDDAQSAEAAVVNTCCFINDAKQESIDTILELAELRKSGKLRALIVAGCLGQRYKEEIQKEIPEVDSILGTTAFDKIVEALDEVLKGQVKNYFESIDRKPVTYNRILSTGTAYSYLKIAEGCNKNCTYCIIPKVRGHYRSVPMEDLIKEAEELAYNGIKELIIVAQETTVYGVDLYGKKMLPELLTKLCRIEGFEWIRIMYCYPEEITDELIQTIKNNPKVCHYLDMPIQHASSKVLKAMGRRTTNSEIKKTIARLRKEIPDIVLRTTMMTGFPGETEEDHKILLEFIKDERIDRLGAFAYSKEDNTKAFSMKNQVNGNTRKRRLKEVMLTQQKVAFELCKEKVGRTLEVLTEGYIPEDDIYVGRSYMDAPGVDGYVFYSCDYELKTGDMVKVQITSSNEYDLIGEVTE